MFIAAVFLLFASVSEGTALQKSKTAPVKKSIKTPLKRGGLSSKVKPKTKQGGGLKLEGSTHQVINGMTQLSDTLNKMRGAASDGGNGLTDNARRQFMRVVESAMKLEDKLAGGGISDTFRDILFEAQLLLELIEFKQTGRIDVDTTTNLLEAETHMFRERTTAESMRLQELVGLEVFEELEFDPNLFEEVYGEYFDEYEDYDDGFGYDEISVERRNELMRETERRWSVFEPVLKTKGFTAPGKLTDVRNCMFWWVEPVQRLMLVQNVAASATILNFTQEVGHFLASDGYRHGLNTVQSKKAKSTGMAIEALGKNWYAATNAVELAKVRNTFVALRGDIIDVARHAPKDLDTSQLHLPTYGEDEDAFDDAFTGGVGRVSLKEEFDEELYLPEDSFVKNAWYGNAMHTMGKNVTEIVNKLLKAGQRVHASNELFGDTAYGVGKFLLVDYERKEMRTAECTEAENDNIEQIAAESVVSAFYGTIDRIIGIDVTAKVKDLLKNEQPVNASYELYGDPVYGKGKHLYVDYNSRINAVSGLLESKFYAMKLMLESAQQREKGAPVFIPDLMNALVNSVSRIQTLKESELTKKKEEADDGWYFSHGVMSLRDLMQSLVFPQKRFVVDEV